MHSVLFTVYLCVVFGLTNNVYGGVLQRHDYDYAMQEPVDKDCDEAEHEKTCSLKLGNDDFSYFEMTPDQGWISRSCPEGTAFSIEDCGCSISLPQEAAQYSSSSSSSSEEDENCEKVEPVPCTRKASEDSKTYLQFVEGKGWIEQACAKGTAYNNKDCACTISLPQSDISDSSSEEDCETAKPVPCTRKPSDESGCYMQFIDGKGWVKQSCAKGTEYNPADCACTVSVSYEDSSSSSEEDCGTAEPVPCTRKPGNDVKSYLQFVEGKGWIEQSCAKGTLYNEQDCACTISLPQEDISSSSEEDCEKPEDAPCTRKTSQDYDHYLQYVEGKGWIEQSCPKGTLYNEQDCACTISLPQEDISSSSEEDCEKPEDAPCTRKTSQDYDHYLQYVEGKGWIEKSCPKGTLYNEQDCACTISLPQEDISSSSEEDCEKPEDAPCTRKTSQDYDHYLQYVEGKGWIEQSCPKGTLYNEQDCACTISLPQEDISSSSEEKEDCEPLEPAPCTRKSDSDRKFYLQFIEGKGYVRRACAKGTAYNDEDCSCSISLPSEFISSSSSSSSSEENSENAAQQTCTLEAADDQTSFRQYEKGYGWTVKNCPTGTAFSSEDCGCSVILPVVQKPDPNVPYGIY